MACETTYVFLRFFFKIQKNDFLRFFGVADHVFSNTGPWIWTLAIFVLRESCFCCWSLQLSPGPSSWFEGWAMGRGEVRGYGVGRNEAGEKENSGEGTKGGKDGGGKRWGGKEYGP